MEDDPDEDEDYDVVEVRMSHNLSMPSLPSQPSSSHTIYDVPKSSLTEGRTRSSWSLDQGQDRRPPPPLPSPRKYLQEGRSLPATPSATKPPSIYDTKVSNRAVRNLFDQTDGAREEEVKTSVSPQFSSKTLKPKKEPEESGGGTRPRNRSLSLKQPEAVYNELSLILEKRRQNLETKPTPPDRPRNLTLETKACPPSFPPYSKVNKVSRQQKDVPESDSAGTVPRSNVPPRSFLHSFAQSGKLSQLQSREENKKAFSTFKGW